MNAAANLVTMRRTVPALQVSIAVSSVHLVDDAVQVALELTGGYLRAGCHLSAEQARALAAVLIECADHYDAQRAAADALAVAA